MATAKTRAKLSAGAGTRPLSLETSRWRIRSTKGLQIVEAVPFTKFKWLVHGFSTRQGGESVLGGSDKLHASQEKFLNLGFTDWDSPERVESNRKRFLASLGGQKLTLLTLRQIHSDIVHVANELSGETQIGDAWITRTRGLLISVQTADCAPILLVDPRLRAVAALHAGWRGTLARIASKAVGRMQMEFGSRPEDLLAAVGARIGPCCYEVGPDVVNEFSAQFPHARNWFGGPFDSMASGEDPNPLPWLTMAPPGHAPSPPRCFLDLAAANSAILVEAGLNNENIFPADACTACQSDMFFSYRRERRTGRMMAVIGIV